MEFVSVDLKERTEIARLQWRSKYMTEMWMVEILRNFGGLRSDIFFEEHVCFGMLFISDESFLYSHTDANPLLLTLQK